MKIWQYFRKSFAKKRARRVTSAYGYRVDRFDLERTGTVAFANWENPLVKPIRITQGMVDFFQQFIRPGDLAIDIGANIGDTTVPMALAAGVEGRTLGFDPNPLVFEILQQNAGLNKDKTHIVPLRFAITERESSFYYVSSEASFANGGISETRESRHGRFVYPERIRGINLQQYLEEHYPQQLNRLSFIKVDAEGYDKEILKSIAPLLEQYKPTVVAESFGNNTDAQKEELFEILASKGYGIRYFADFDIAAGQAAITEARGMTRYRKTINILARHSEKC